jgi:hypothetical protein
MNRAAPKNGGPFFITNEQDTTVELGKINVSHAMQ